jgi:nucleotide-binding universal stress UspA family protein
MKILVAVDGSPFTKRMLEYLSSHEEWLATHHEYAVLYVTPALPPHAASMFDKSVLKAYYADEADKVFKPIRAFFEKHGITADYISKVGAAGDVIADVSAKGGFELLMMGSHGHGALGKLVLGSVSTRVMAHCETPVLIIR